MEFQDVVRRRHMVREYTDQPVPDEVVERLLRNAPPPHRHGALRTVVNSARPGLDGFEARTSQDNRVIGVAGQ